MFSPSLPHGEAHRKDPVVPGIRLRELGPRSSLPFARRFRLADSVPYRAHICQGLFPGLEIGWSDTKWVCRGKIRRRGCGSGRRRSFVLRKFTGDASVESLSFVVRRFFARSGLWWSSLLGVVFVGRIQADRGSGRPRPDGSLSPGYGKRFPLVAPGPPQAVNGRSPPRVAALGTFCPTCPSMLPWGRCKASAVAGPAALYIRGMVSSIV